MKKIEFSLSEKSRANKAYFLIEYYGGDADTQHPEEYILPFNYDEINDNLEYIEKEYEKYVKLRNILNINHEDFCQTYTEVLEKHGEEMANMIGEVPCDPQTDFDSYCAIDYICLIGYDNEGNKYLAYL